MKNISIPRPRVVQFSAFKLPLLLGATLLFFWHGLPFVSQQQAASVGLVDSGLWQLLLFSLMSFVLLFFTSIVLFAWLLSSLGLPQIMIIVSQFKLLTLWQQFVAYGACFALLFAGALLSLVAVF